MVRAMAIEMVVRATCMRRAYSCLVWLVQTGSVAVPVDMNKNKNKNNLPLATVLTILLYYRIDAESEVAIQIDPLT